MTLKTIYIKTVGGAMIIGFFFLESKDEIVILNSYISSINLGKFQNIVKKQVQPEATITVIPKKIIKSFDYINI